ncbi:MAG: ribonuclease P protein component [Candidatus Omnitrophica bacterium]|nr:ribonuclease P protein component [Candidatus Omnitrophota bacterium]
MAKLARLKKTSEYRRVYKSGKLFKNGPLWAYFLPAPGEQISTGVSVSSRIIRKATERNRLKRVIKESLKRCAEDYKTGGCDIVVVVKKNILSNRAGSLLTRATISKLLEKYNETVANKSN